MAIVYQEKIEPYSAQDMFNLVNDVDAYPIFLPWCKATKSKMIAENIMEASVMIAKGPLTRWFTTRNQLTKNQQILLNLVDGPFKYLKGSWNFIDLDSGGCKVIFKIDFEFSFGPAQMLLTPIFEGITSSMVNAFSRRAKDLYSLHD